MKTMLYLGSGSRNMMKTMLYSRQQRKKVRAMIDFFPFNGGQSDVVDFVQGSIIQNGGGNDEERAIIIG